MSIAISISNSVKGALVPGGGGTPFVNTYSMSFDGVDEYIEVGSPTSIQSLTSAITISFWIKAPRVFSTNYYTPLSKGEYAAVGSQWSIKVNTANLRNTSGGSFSVFPNSNAITDTQTVSFPTAIDDNQWHHLMCVNDGTDLKIYLDGQLEATGLGKGRTLYNGNRSLKLGRLTSTSSTGLLKGNLDEVAIFGTALQLSDAQTIYNGGAPTDLSSLSPVSWWRMGDGDIWNGSVWTLTDNGSGGNDATSVFMEEADRLPISPNSYSQNSFVFDGIDDFVTLGNDASLQISGNFSISVWIKYSSIIQAYAFSGCGNKYGIYVQNNLINLQHRDTGNVFRNVTSTSTFNDNQWHHVLGVNDGTNLKLYIDGTLNNSNSLGGANITSTLDARIGSISTASGWEFSGKIDEVYIWNNDQSGNISTIYGNGVPTDLSSLNPLGHWRFGETDIFSTTWTFVDQGSGGNDGTSSTLPEEAKTGDQPYVL